MPWVVILGLAAAVNPKRAWGLRFVLLILAANTLVLC